MTETLPQTEPAEPSCFLPGTKTQSPWINTREEEYATWLIEKAIINGECWECHLAPVKKGYCYVSVDGRYGIKWRVHRLVWAVYEGQLIKDNMLVLHSCDNRKCINPKHLFLGNEADNTADMMIKGRGKYILPDNRKIKAEQLARIIELRQSGKTLADIATELGVCASTIANNLRGQDV